jgi:hypothetical protein
MQHMLWDVLRPSYFYSPEEILWFCEQQSSQILAERPLWIWMSWTDFAKSNPIWKGRWVALQGLPCSDCQTWLTPWNASFWMTCCSSVSPGDSDIHEAADMFRSPGQRRYFSMVSLRVAMQTRNTKQESAPRRTVRRRTATSSTQEKRHKVPRLFQSLMLWPKVKVYAKGESICETLFLTMHPGLSSYVQETCSTWRFSSQRWVPWGRRSRSFDFCVHLWWEWKPACHQSPKFHAH